LFTALCTFNVQTYSFSEKTLQKFV
jgi:hypothetical protein